MNVFLAELGRAGPSGHDRPTATQFLELRDLRKCAFAFVMMIRFGDFFYMRGAIGKYDTIAFPMLDGCSDFTSVEAFDHDLLIKIYSAHLVEASWRVVTIVVTAPAYPANQSQALSFLSLDHGS
ncbi:hypothetical protein AX777_13925 [Sphingobium yanoikuyae]|uniref:Uncharacterized protein n=1 Tax=Sphingobium yanoikuyae TaxID=13690 RepID=A0A177JM48_SPHYA|nr:hypothetical protein AX777_13925 [Sphingobium yanoikuyae]